METQNKQWVCHPALDNCGQLGPEDLSSNSKNLQNRLGINDKQQTIPNKEQEVISDIKNKNGLDQFFVQQVEDAICEHSRQTIVRILDEVTRLSSTEKLLLYLKLPTDLNNVSDPLRQPLNPLGSRSEISQTIMWIRTHLEEDPELSLPKQDVYLDYNIHCANNKMKPLSTADFGKVMKQVYPSVRPRRLGTRGNSRYCYAGLRKRFKLEVPQLPDLGDRPQSTETVCPQTELTKAACKLICEWAETILGTAFENILVLTSYLIRVHPQSVNIHSREAAMIVAYSEDFQYNKDTLSQELLPYSNHVNLKHKEAQIQLQRKLQQREFKRKLQLQSPKKEGKGKCKKSRMQNSGGTPTRTLSLDSVESESPKSQGYQLNTVCDKSSNECTNVPTLPDFSSFHQKKPPLAEEEVKPVIKKDTTDIIGATNKPKTPLTTPTPVTLSVVQVSSRSSSLDSEQLYERTPVSVDETITELKPNLDGKLPIPRLPSQKIKPNIHPPKTVILQTPKKSQRNQKYKAIQPKPVKCDTNQADTTQGSSSEPTSSLDTADVIQIAADDSLKNADYLTRERLISVSNVDKDALDDYLHGGNNSQEQEEELMRYFKNNNNTNNNNSDSYEHSVQPQQQSQPHQQQQQQQQQQQSNNIPTTTQADTDELSNGSKSYRLSQLRLLLEQNLNANMSTMSAPAHMASEPVSAGKSVARLSGSSASAFMKAAERHSSMVPSASAGLTMLSQNLALQSHLNSGMKRRVSFETSVIENDTIPPSPNTRRKNFSFTPISPGPHSPGGGRQSKCSSTNASPFVSPRNTPVPRAKASSNYVQNQVPASFVAQQTVPAATTTTRKHMGIIKPTLKTTVKHEPELYGETEKMFGDLIEEKHFVNPTDIMPKCNLPMSAPPSPMLPYKHKMNNTNLLQKLLDSNSKVSYVPDYEKGVHNATTNQSLNVADSLSQEVSQLLAESGTHGFQSSENSYRSQSVPLHQMTSFKTLMSPCMPNSQQTHFNFNFSSANNSVAPTPVPEEFADFEPFSELNTGLNNDNLNQILNILETTQSTNHIDEPTSDPSETPQAAAAAAAENVFNFDTNAANMMNAELLNQNPVAVNDPLQSSDLLTVQKLIRSQSIDIDMDMRGLCADAKYVQPSRSVPSTPLPYTKTKPHLELNLNNNQADMQPMLDETMFACRPLSDQDFLLNGQPVKNKYGFDTIGEEHTDMSTDPQNFPPSLGFTMNEPMNNDDNKINTFTRNSAAGNYGARRNLNTLLEQQYSEAD